ncbi:MAG: hypothetical protein ACFFBP_13945 [Promethearchaeota archaeon]
MIANHFNTEIYENLKEYTNNQGNIPPFIGCLIADKDGKTLLRFEIFEGALYYFLKNNMNDDFEEEFDLDLIPMFISAFERFSETINFKDLSGLNLMGTGLKMHTFFCFEKFTVTFFLNPRVQVKLISNIIKDFLKVLFKDNEMIFNNFYVNCSREDLSRLEFTGNSWLNKINKYLSYLIK